MGRSHNFTSELASSKQAVSSLTNITYETLFRLVSFMFYLLEMSSLIVLFLLLNITPLYSRVFFYFFLPCVISKKKKLSLNACILKTLNIVKNVEMNSYIILLHGSTCLTI